VLSLDRIGLDEFQLANQTGKLGHEIYDNGNDVRAHRDLDFGQSSLASVQQRN
jgi:hypothetical protein